MCLSHAELHLGNVASFVYCQHRHPWQRFGVVCGRYREEVHPSRSPCNGTVGRIVCVHHDRHAQLSRTSAEVSS